MNKLLALLLIICSLQIIICQDQVIISKLDVKFPPRLGDYKPKPIPKYNVLVDSSYKEKWAPVFKDLGK